MKIFQFLLSVFIVIHLSLGVILADPSSSYNNDKSNNNDKSEPVNVDYKNGSIAAYNGKFLVAIKHLERATKTAQTIRMSTICWDTVIENWTNSNRHSTITWRH